MNEFELKHMFLQDEKKYETRAIYIITFGSPWAFPWNQNKSKISKVT